VHLDDASPGEAFLVATEGGVPVVPVAMRGTRSLLRGDQWFARRADLRVVIGSPIPPQGPDWLAALSLRDAARHVLLERTGEPDLDGWA
jgi:1-acyl-sn-glycerol-3-phosphate acyltransferase